MSINPPNDVTAFIVGAFMGLAFGLFLFKHDLQTLYGALHDFLEKRKRE